MTTAATEPSNAEGSRGLALRAVEGVIWTTVGYGLQQVLRLGSNLILTRLLVPEAFGLMSLTFVFITGLELLSDVGLAPAIIQSKRGDDARLLDTAWTVQIIRGFVLSLGAVAVAWPAAYLYHQPQLTPLLCAAGVGCAIRGFTPTRVHTLNRKVMLGRLTAMELVTQVVTIAITVTAAWLLRSVWALLVGTLAGHFVRVVLSYRMLPGHSHHLLLDGQSMSELLRIGRWVFFSTAVTFAAGNLDRLVLGRLMSVAELGLYAIALQLLQAVVNVGRMAGSRVLFPVLAETARANPELLRRRLRRARLAWVLPTAAVLLVLAVAGDWIVALLYRDDYHDSGWMVRILSAGYVVGAVNQSRGVVWQAIGDFRMSTMLLVVQVVVLFGGMMLGYALAGSTGFIWGVAAVEPIMYPIQSLMFARHKLWQPEIDLPVLALSAAIIAVGALAR